MDVVEFLLPPLIASFLLIGITVYFGIHVIKREIIFIDIALAQIAALGVAVAHVLNESFFTQHYHSHGSGESDFFAYMLSIVFCTLAALLFTLLKNKVVRIPLEAIIGITYAVATCGAVIIYDTGAGGDVHVQEMLTGAILWTSWDQIIRLLIVFGTIGVFHIIFRSKFIMITSKYLNSDVKWNGSKLWDFLFYFTFGIVIVEAVRICGIITVFAFLIIPASISALLATSWIHRILIGLGIGVIVSITGLYITWVKDIPCSPLYIILLGISLIIVIIVRWLKSVIWE